MLFLQMFYERGLFLIHYTPSTFHPCNEQLHALIKKNVHSNRSINVIPIRPLALLLRLLLQATSKRGEPYI